MPLKNLLIRIKRNTLNDNTVQASALPPSKPVVKLPYTITITRIVVVGAKETGKTQFINQFHVGKFDPAYIQTITMDYKSVVVQKNGETRQYNIWDTPGNERFQKIIVAHHHSHRYVCSLCRSFR